jgi:sarcosine oxidase
MPQPFDTIIIGLSGMGSATIPTLNSPCLETVTYLYTNTPDQHFVVGLHPEWERVAIASPCSGHGYKFASVIGEILADLAIDGKTKRAIDLFDPMRFQ